MGGYSKISIHRARASALDAATALQTVSDTIERKAGRARGTHQVLRAHPNLEFPPVPKGLTPENVVRFTLACVAQYLSPVKLDGEDNNFQCEDVARAIRMELTRELVDAVNLAILEGRATIKGA